MFALPGPAKYVKSTSAVQRVNARSRIELYVDSDDHDLWYLAIFAIACGLVGYLIGYKAGWEASLRRKPQVYVCGPYRIPSPTTNTHRAVEAGRIVRDLVGAVPSIPHLSLMEDAILPETDQYWLNATLDQMRCCDAVYRFTQDYSVGADAEVAEAERIGLPVFTTLPTLTSWVKQWEQHAEA
jgi:hypothetical protein